MVALKFGNSLSSHMWLQVAGVGFLRAKAAALEPIERLSGDGSERWDPMHGTAYVCLSG